MKIKLDKEREIRFDLNAMVKFEQATGKSALESLANLTATDFRALVWACLVNSDLTIEDVGKWVTVKNMPELTDKLVQAIGGDSPFVPSG